MTVWKKGNGRVPDDKDDFEGGDVFKWDGIAVFPNASKLAKLAFELTWCAAVIKKYRWKKKYSGMMTNQRTNVTKGFWSASMWGCDI